MSETQSETAPGGAPAAWSNADWVGRLSDGGAEAAAAERELRRFLVAGLRRALGQRAPGDACEDFAQDALLRIRAQLPTFRGESRFTSWALSIAVRVAFDELRHQRWKDVSFDALTSGAEGPVRFEPREEASQERRLSRDRALAALQQALEGDLTDKQRRVLLAELSGMPHAEIALQLGMNRNALYKLAHDARRKLKGRLEAAGLSAEEVLWAFT